MSALITLLILILVVGLVVWVAFWAIDTLGVPEPINKVGKVLLVIVALLILLAQALPLLHISI